MPDPYLIGSDSVASAGRQISGAADEMRRAAATIDEALARHQNWMNDWLSRFEEIVSRLKDGRDD